MCCRSLQRTGTFLTSLCWVFAGCAGGPDLVPGSTATEHIVPQSKVETGVNLGRIQERQGSLVKALDLYEGLHQSDPKNADVCHRLMVVHSRLDHPQEADAFFQKADQLKPNNADLYADYGYACYLRGDMEAAESWLKKAHNLRPREKRITSNLALVLGTQGRVEESLTYFRQFLDDAQAEANVGYALIQRGDFAAAREHYNEALNINPKLKPAQHALLQLAEWERAKQHQLAQVPHESPPHTPREPQSESSSSQQRQATWQPAGAVNIQ